MGRFCFGIVDLALELYVFHWIFKPCVGFLDVALILEMLRLVFGSSHRSVGFAGLVLGF